MSMAASAIGVSVMAYTVTCYVVFIAMCECEKLWATYFKEENLHIIFIKKPNLFS